jgi:hypothetical protein
VIVALLAAALNLTHVWIVVPTGAPQRALLEKAGFRIDPTINHHTGQGTSSITIEFDNGFLELIYPDPGVAVADALIAGAEKFRLKSEWRTSGYSPIGIVFDRTSSTPATFPFPTWRISADWMDKGSYIEMLTPREMAKAISLSVASHPFTPRGAANPNGARRITRLHIVAPSSDRFPPAAAYVADITPVRFDAGADWLLEATFDEGKQSVTKDFRPELPLIVHY